MLKKIVSILLAMLMLVSLMTACAGSKPSSQASEQASSQTPAAKTAKEPLRVAVQSFYCSSLVGLIQKEGWPDSEGLPIELQVFSNGATINEAMGEWDIAVTGGAFVYALANYNCKLVAHQINGTDGNNIVARKGDKVINLTDKKAIADAVRGKTFLTSYGTTGHYTLNLWLDSIGVKAEECNILNLDIPNIYSSWIAGQGDYAVLTAPYCYYDMDKIDSAVISSLAKVGASQYEATVATADALENRRDDIVKFVEWIYRANDMLAADKGLTNEVVKKWYTDSGKTVTDDQVNQETKSKPFITSAEAKNMKFGDFAMSYADWYASRKLIEPSTLDAVKSNIASDVLTEALSHIK